MKTMNIMDKSLLKELLSRYIRLNYRSEQAINERKSNYFSTDMDVSPILEKTLEPNVEKTKKLNQDVSINNLRVALPKKSLTFNERLFQLIDQKHLDEVRLYQSIGITRTHFSKIRSNPHYQPTKETVFKLAIGMKLNLEEGLLLLQSAGFSFKLSVYGDLIVRWALHHEVYQQAIIDEVLVEYKEKPLFSLK
jgi:hypothetical protein